MAMTVARPGRMAVYQTKHGWVWECRSDVHSFAYTFGIPMYGVYFPTQGEAFAALKDHADRSHQPRDPYTRKDFVLAN